MQVNIVKVKTGEQMKHTDAAERAQETAAATKPSRKPVPPALPAGVVTDFTTVKDDRPVKFLCTPEMAEMFLENNKLSNRDIVKSKVFEFAKDMASGNWHDIYEYVKLDKNYNILDGVHRLTAVKVANVPVVLNVVFNARINSVARSCINNSATMTIGAYAKIDGMDRGYGADNYSVAKYVLSYVRNHTIRPKVKSMDTTITIGDIRQEILAHPDVYKHLRRNRLRKNSTANENVKWKKMLLCGIEAMMLVLRPELADKTKSFFDDLYEQHLTRGSMVWHLNRYLTSRRHDWHAMHTKGVNFSNWQLERELYCAVVQMWARYVAGETKSAVRIHVGTPDGAVSTLYPLIEEVAK